MKWTNFNLNNNNLLLTDDSDIFKVLDDPSYDESDSSTGLILYSSSSEPTVLNKTQYLNIFLDTSYFIKNPASIVNPVLTINYSGVLDANYAYIREFNRYYFIVDIISISKNVWELHLHSDVLMSFRDNTLNQTALITRNQYDFNVDLRDSVLPLSYIPIREYAYSVLSSPLSFARSHSSFVSDASPPNILCICIGPEDTEFTDYNISVNHNLSRPSDLKFNGATGGMRIYALNPKQLHILSDDLRDNQLFNDWDSIWEEPSESMIKIIAVPFNIPVNWIISDNEKITLGNVTLKNAVGKRIIQNMAYTITIGKINIPKSNINFLNSRDYSRYELYLPCCGFIDLDPLLLFNTEYIIIKYCFDFTNNGATAYILNQNDILLQQVSFRLGIEVPFSYTRATETARNNLLSSLNFVGTTVAGAVSGFFVGGPVGAALGGVGAGASRAYSIVSKETNYDLGQVAGAYVGAIDGMKNGMIDIIHSGQQHYQHGISNGDASSWYGPLQPFICYTHCNSLAGDDYNSRCGRPLLEFRTLNTVHGYTQCSNIHLVGYDNATTMELEELRNILTTGVILP